MDKHLLEFLENFKDYAVFDYNKERSAVRSKVANKKNLGDHISGALAVNREMERRATKVYKKNKKIIVCFFSELNFSDHGPETIPLMRLIEYQASIILEIYKSGIYVVKADKDKTIKFCNEEQTFERQAYFKYPSNAEDFIMRLQDE